METEHHARLTSAEIAALWTSYQTETMAICGIAYFLAKAEDESTRSVLNVAMDMTRNHVQRISAFFREEGFPLPVGFTDQDVDTSAPRLYTDAFFLNYMLNMGKLGMASCTMALAGCSRSDVAAFYSQCIVSNIELFNMARQKMLEKGVLTRAPNVPALKQPEFVQQEQFLGKWFGHQRPLLALEISNLAYNIDRNFHGKALIIGFSQTAKSEQVRRYFARGRDIAQKHVAVFSEKLSDEFIPLPRTLDTEVTDSTVAPFSDKLMMFHISMLTASGVGQYGISMSTSLRSDLNTAYARLAAEIVNYALDGVNLMIRHGWLEKPPQSADRRALAHT